MQLNRIDTLFDCAIIGGGPAGLNAALILGRARRNAILLDNNTPRNAVTQESHGFITRDGIKPKEFTEIAHKELGRYPSIRYEKREVISVQAWNTAQNTEDKRKKMHAKWLAL